MLCFRWLRSTIRTDSTVQQGVVQWLERERERERELRSQCYHDRACTLVKTLGHVYPTVILFADLCKSENFDQKKIPIWRLLLTIQLNGCILQSTDSMSMQQYLLGKYLQRWPMLRIELNVFSSRSGRCIIIFQSFYRLQASMCACAVTSSLRFRHD